MKGKSKLEDAFDLIRLLFAEAVSEAEKNAVANWLANQAIQHGSIKTPAKGVRTAKNTQAERAPKGVARQLVEKVMRKAGKDGVSPSAITSYAETDEEKMVSYSAVRLELNRGYSARPRKYYSEGGKWYSAM